MDEIKRTINGKAHPHVAKDPRNRQRETLTRRFVPNTVRVLGVLEQHLVDLREVALNPLSILEYFQRGQLIPEFEVGNPKDFQEQLKHVIGFPDELVANIKMAYLCDDIELDVCIEQIRFEHSKTNSEHIDAYNFMIHKLFVQMGGAKILVPPYGDISAFEFIINKTFNIPVDRSEAILATQFKNEVVVPKFISRLTQLIEAGFELDPQILKDRTDLLYGIPVFVDVDDHKRTHGYYNSSLFSIHISHFIEGVSEAAAMRNLFHELAHALSATSDDSGKEITNGLRRTFYSEDKEVEARHTKLGRALNEAFTSSLQEWLLSDITPNFRNMTVAEFFKGPGDFDGTYEIERRFFAEFLANMPISAMTRAYFEDCTLPNDIRETQSYTEFVDTLNDFFPGGFDGCSKLWEFTLQQQAQLMENSLTL